jgi:mono/diheme cytochrome c family protein
MKSLSTPFLAAGLLLAFSGTLHSQDTAADQVQRGAEVYGATCGRCHTARSPLERLDREWVTIGNHMRVRANLTGPQTRAVLAFLQATNGDPRQPAPLERAAAVDTPPEDYGGAISTDPNVIEQGKTLVQRNACIGCHVVSSAGGNVGPSLNGVVGQRGAAFVRQKIAQPTFNTATSMMPRFGLSREQIDAITSYLASLDRS